MLTAIIKPAACILVPSGFAWSQIKSQQTNERTVFGYAAKNETQPNPK